MEENANENQEAPKPIQIDALDLEKVMHIETKKALCRAHTETVEAQAKAMTASLCAKYGLPTDRNLAISAEGLVTIA